jgi:capsular polysaccharide biosynthesis protein
MSQGVVYLQIIISGWWIIIGTTLFGTGGAYLYTYSQPNIYESSATYVARSKLLTSDPRDLVDSLDTLSSRTTVVSTYCEILRSNAIIEEASHSLGLTREATSGYQSSCVVFTDSTVVELTVRGRSPYLATDLANAIGNSGLEYINSLQEIYDLSPLDTAAIDTDPVAPNHQLDIIIAAGVSLLGGCALAFLNWWLSSLRAVQAAPTELLTELGE